MLAHNAIALRRQAASSRLLGVPVFLAASLGAIAPAGADMEDAFKARPGVVTPLYRMKRPSYDAPGIEIGDFLATPVFSENLAGDDNIFVSGKNPGGDLIFTSSEDLNLQSQWLRDSAQLNLHHAHDAYTKHPTENANTYGVDGNLRFDIAAEGSLELSAGFLQQPQKRNSAQADSRSLARPIYNTIPVSAAYTQDWGRWHNDLKVEISRTAYISQTDAARSAIQSRYHERLSFALTGDAWSFLQVAYATQDWRLNPALRNFDTVTAMAGFKVQLTDVVDVDMGAGVLRQHYLFAGFDDLVEPTFSAHLIWNIQPLTTLSAAADQTVTGLETFCDHTPGNPACAVAPGLPGAGNLRGALEVTSAQVGLQHEFWHDILGEVRFRFEQDRFDPTDLVDRNYSALLGARFLLTRNLEVDASYVFNTRTANQDILLYNSGAYQANTVSLTLKAAL